MVIWQFNKSTAFGTYIWNFLRLAKSRFVNSTIQRESGHVRFSASKPLQVVIWQFNKSTAFGTYIWNFSRLAKSRFVNSTIQQESGHVRFSASKPFQVVNLAIQQINGVWNLYMKFFETCQIQICQFYNSTRIWTC